MSGMCSKPDRDVPSLICGYPLPCPYHTVTIHTEKSPPTVEIPATIPQAANPEMLSKLKQIANVLKPQQDGGE